MKNDSLFKNFNSDKIATVIAVAVFLVIAGIAIADEFINVKSEDELDAEWDYPIPPMNKD